MSIATINWTDGSIIGPIIAAIIALFGVILTIRYNKKKGADKGDAHSQSSVFSNKGKQYQAGRDIHISEGGTKKKQ